MGSRLTPTTDIIRALFARSGNQCAFPGCTHSLINPKNQFIAQICHIESAQPGGERYNKNQDDESRRGYDNLILLCYQHHVETNDILEYPVEKLKKLKYDHENKSSDFKINESALIKIIEEMNSYWMLIEKLNKFEHNCPDFAVDINTKASFTEIMRSCEENIKYISDFHCSLKESDGKLMQDFIDLLLNKEIAPELFEDIPYYEHPFEPAKKNWELHNLGIPNRMLRLKIDLKHLELKYLEEFVKTHKDDLDSRNQLEDLKKEFANIAKNAGLAD
jgi:hypothetical protein